MANMTKFNKATNGAVMRHIERSGKNHGNENIKHELTKNNVNLHEHDLSAREFLAEKCRQVPPRNKETVLNCAWVMTVPPEVVNHGHEDEFAKHFYNFLAERYGKENIIYCVHHKDELYKSVDEDKIHHHLHAGITPIKDGKFNAKEVVSRNDLKTFHNDLQKEMNKHFDYEISVLTEQTKEYTSMDKHKAEKELDIYRKVQELVNTYRGTEKHEQMLFDKALKNRDKKAFRNLSISPEDYVQERHRQIELRNELTRDNKELKRVRTALDNMVRDRDKYQGYAADFLTENKELERYKKGFKAFKDINLSDEQKKGLKTNLDALNINMHEKNELLKELGIEVERLRSRVRDFSR